MTSCLIRHARPEDLDTLVDFTGAMALETEGRALDRATLRRGVSAVLEAPARGFYVIAQAPAAQAPRPIGQLMVTFEWSDWRNGTFWWIQSVYVHPEWRRRGVYRDLHAFVVQEARARADVVGIRLYVDADNDAAQAAYRRVGLLPSNYLVYETDFVLPQARRARHRP